MVFTADDGYKSVDYTRFTPVLIEAVKELDIKINSIAINSSTSTVMYVENGNIGIGTSAPEYKLHVIGDVAATSFVNISTRTKKKDIEYTSEEDNLSALTKIKGMSIARYRYNIENETDPLRLGLIAEESPEEILSADGKGVDIYKLSTFILAGVKAQQVKIEDLEMRVADLEQLTVDSSQQIAGGVSIDSVLTYFESLGVKMMANVVEFKDVVAEKLTADKVVTNGIEMVDEVTGEVYCVKIQNGMMVNIPGECSTVSAGDDEVIPESSNEAPTILIQGNNPAQIEIDSTYVDMGVIAQDSNGNDLGVYLQLNGASTTQISLDTSTSTTYIITYTTTDNNGTTVSVERTVIVGEGVEEVDSSQPTADSNNEDPTPLEPTVTDGDLSLTGQACDTDNLDLCTTQIECEGVTAYWYNNVCNIEEETPLEDTVVFDDLPLTGQAPPIITLTGLGMVQVNLNETYTDEGATAVDETDGDITANIITDNTVDTATAGMYIVTYNVTDTVGNHAFEVVRAVIVTDF